MRSMVVMLLVVSIFFNQGCCSIFCSGSEVVSVNSKPEGASVKVGPYKGVTPYKVTLPRGKDYIIEAKYGDKTETLNLNRAIEPLYWVNILVWPGLIIDLATGKMYKYEPAEYEFNFGS